MGGLKSTLVLAGAVTAGVSTTAIAADMPIYVPDPAPVAAPVEIGGGWYLRGDIGVSNQRVDKLYNVLYDTAASVTTTDKSFDAAPFFVLGAGYQVNSWFRADLTGEYRGRSAFKGRDVYRPFNPNEPSASDIYTGSKTEWVVLANAYIDLGTWSGLTPYVGAGIGGAYNTIHDFRDVNPETRGGGYAGRDGSEWNFAWALYAGLAYQLTPSVALDFGYRYLHLGDGKSGDIIRFDGVNQVYNPMQFKDLSSHDFKVGLRWMLGAPAIPAALPPVVAKY
ncbi:acyloxyacyl hydrolase [Chelatococcus sp. SYSU_G07232]|uniref:Acyloxyacyl hydrolase n=1 Tax=Chelatococcus albus TaxID=3047466 RepID=A0ABT7AFT0_9HYPH|nr:outer membrane beta-barrel protein [Chelatococcus sp. SYSU_G07232]MDJ1158234.1 acyloxyacyl hydrolase [Chelatococcus sp. SYSU_G07232]